MKSKIDMNPKTRKWIFAGYNELEEFVKSVKMMRCPKCKAKTLHKEVGYEMVNQRFLCMKCSSRNYEGVYID